MELDLIQVDAFASKPFTGNPAAVIPLNEWLPDVTLQAIAEENNLSETAFFIPTARGYHLRWFTPISEVKLCGHATLASAFVIQTILGQGKGEILFETLSGDILVTHKDGLFTLNLPAQPPKKSIIPEIMEVAFGVKILECLEGEDYILVLEKAEQVKKVAPNFELLRQLPLRGVIITAVDKKFDFVTRFFAPKYGVNEDPVTGAAFTQLFPYWGKKLQKNTFTAAQLSKRGGVVTGELLGDRVMISGRARVYLTGKIKI
ncbi:MAG: PhzF family phenazine biosynthesis protein [SAR324 cluster bacterium]|nr:PhzF family phenazine biosynthesis protein [SAR324 cluster bacterium]